MDFEKIVITDQQSKEYCSQCINKIFAILGIFEECEDSGDMSSYYSYLDRVIMEFNGIKDMFQITTFMSLVGVLDGLRLNENANHKQVRQIVFHCISLIKKEQNIK